MSSESGIQGVEYNIRALLSALAIIAAVMVGTLYAQNRVWWCEAGDMLPWSFDIWSPHNSQHVIDPYSLSHLEHGLGLYVLLRLLFGKRLSYTCLVIVVAVIEASWEVIENTEAVIQRYREATISLDYSGDSIINSLGDYASCLMGVAIARRVSFRNAVIAFAVLEVISLFWIRDSLLINIVMLIYPVDAIRNWQTPA
ncbi:MAG: DUF2585 family protein [Planctomycetales bacterium]|nr:DUF2585 family protein [Planctomycetales bacterium]